MFSRSRFSATEKVGPAIDLHVLHSLASGRARASDKHSIRNSSQVVRKVGTTLYET